MPDIGTAIKKIRQASNLGLAEVATAAKISVPLLSQIENGGRNPSFELIQRLGLVLKIPSDALILFAVPETTKLMTTDAGITALARSLEKLTQAENAFKFEVSKFKEEST